VIAGVDSFVEATFQASDRAIYENGAAGRTAPFDISESITRLLRKLTTRFGLRSPQYR
jgi:hypothetical protein